MESFLKIGVVTSVHGVKGEVKVFSTTDDMDRFRKLKSLYLKEKDGSFTVKKIEGVKTAGNFVVLKLEGISDRDMAGTYRNMELYVDREHAIPLAPDEYYIGDLIGMDVFLEEGDVPFGEITDVLQTGANDVYVIASIKHGEVLIPAIKDCIKSVQIDENKMSIHLLDGLI